MGGYESRGCLIGVLIIRGSYNLGVCFGGPSIFVNSHTAPGRKFVASGTYATMYVQTRHPYRLLHKMCLWGAEDFESSVGTKK